MAMLPLYRCSITRRWLHPSTARTEVTCQLPRMIVSSITHLLFQLLTQSHGPLLLHPITPHATTQSHLWYEKLQIQLINGIFNYQSKFSHSRKLAFKPWQYQKICRPRPNQMVLYQISNILPKREYSKKNFFFFAMLNHSQILTQANNIQKTIKCKYNK